MSQTYSHSENIEEMTRLRAGEKGLALALIVSAALHIALLTMLLSFASGFVQRDVHPLRESFFMAFLVSGNHAVAGKTEALPGRKRLAADRTAPVVTPPREVPAPVAPAEPAEKEGRNPPADILPPAERPGKGHDAGAFSAPASPAAATQTSPVLVPGGGGLSESNGAGSAAARRGGGDFSVGAGSVGTGAGTPASRQDGTGKTRQEGSGARSPKDADLAPRYGDNARPAYPPLARLRGYQGVVVLFVEVLADGRVGQVGIKRSAGHDILDRAALEAVGTWRFEPGRKEGRAVAMSVEVAVRFVLNEYSAWDDRR